MSAALQDWIYPSATQWEWEIATITVHWKGGADTRMISSSDADDLTEMIALTSEGSGMLSRIAIIRVSDLRSVRSPEQARTMRLLIDMGVGIRPLLDLNADEVQQITIVHRNGRRTFLRDGA